MSVTYTRAQLVIEVADNLGVTATGQTLSTDDTTKIDSKLPAIIAELAAKESVYIGDLDNIPAEMFPSVADVCAHRVMNKFGVTGQEAADLTTAAAGALAVLKVIARGRPTYEVLKAEYF